MKFTHMLATSVSLAMAAPRPRTNATPKAAYFLESDPAGANIISLEIGPDGFKGEPQRTSTGGKGLIGMNSNGSVVADPLFCQDAVVVRGNRLFTVNAGSNTLATFHIPEHDPTHPVLVGEPIDTVGTVPNTVAYSEKHNITCVANTGTKPGVQCFHFTNCGSLKRQGEFKPLPIKNQTTPISGAPNTVSDILFNPSETALFVSIKGDGMSQGYVYAYPIHDGKVSEEPVISQSPDLLVPFGMSFVDDQSAVISDPGYGAAFVSIAEDLKVTVDRALTVEGQMTTCWTAYSEERGTVYLMDSNVIDITSLNPETMAVGRVLTGNPAGTGNFDGIIAGDKLFVLEDVPAVSVFDLDNATAGPKVYDLTGFGNRAAWIGMAVYSS